MTIALSSKHTMAGAKRIVIDEGIQLKRLYRRERVALLSLRWQAARDARLKREAAIDGVIERAKRRYVRTQPYEVGNNGTSPHKIIAMVAAWHGISEKEILLKTRRVAIVTAKQDAVAAVYLNCKIDGRRYSLQDLGRVFGFDHTSAHHSLRKRGLR